MNVEHFILPLTVNGKKLKALGSKFKPMKETIYRVSVPWEKWDKAFIFTLKDERTRTFHFYKQNDKTLDEIAEMIMVKLQKSRI